MMHVPPCCNTLALTKLDVLVVTLRQSPLLSVRTDRQSLVVSVICTVGLQLGANQLGRLFQATVHVPASDYHYSLSLQVLLYSVWLLTVGGGLMDGLGVESRINRETCSAHVSSLHSMGEIKWFSLCSCSPVTFKLTLFTNSQLARITITFCVSVASSMLPEAERPCALPLRRQSPVTQRLSGQ